MLKKLLKYDLKFLFKYWWIGAVICLSLSIVSGFGIRLIESSENGRELPAVVTSSAGSIITISIISYIAISIICIILVFMRFYKNFFSDEGYLTFTLPVKSTDLINSKIISTILVQLATSLLICLGIAAMLIIGFWGDFWEVFLSEELWKTIGEFFKTIFGDNTFCRIIYVFEALLLSFLTTVFSNLFLFCCITFASIITQKARVITAIGIYFGINCFASFAIQIFVLFGISTLAEYFEKISTKALEPAICLAGLVAILFIGILCSVLYFWQYRMIDRKLNLT